MDAPSHFAYCGAYCGLCCAWLIRPVSVGALHCLGGAGVMGGYKIIALCVAIFAVLSLSVMHLRVVQSPISASSTGLSLGRYERVQSRCAEELRSLLTAWGAAADWRRLPGTDPDEVRFRAPTRSLGKWIELTIAPKNEKISLFTAHDTLKVVFGENCERKSELLAHEASRHFPGRSRVGGFAVLDDELLESKLADTRSSLLYLWTPHKEISVLGLKEAQAAAKKLGLLLYAVVEPNSSPLAVSRVRSELGLAREQVLWLDSFELQLRGFRLHFPSLILLSAGQFASPVRRGHESAHDYTDYLQRYL